MSQKLPKADEVPEFKSWALVELFGHQRLVGMVTVDPVEFPGMVRVDIPHLLEDGTIACKGLTQYVGKAAIYVVTPITESAVRQFLPAPFE